jgi:hypothetical protein
MLRIAAQDEESGVANTISRAHTKDSTKVPLAIWNVTIYP